MFKYPDDQAKYKNTSSPDIAVNVVLKQLRAIVRFRFLKALQVRLAWLGVLFAGMLAILNTRTMADDREELCTAVNAFLCGVWLSVLCRHLPLSWCLTAGCWTPPKKLLPLQQLGQ